MSQDPSPPFHAGLFAVKQSVEAACRVADRPKNDAALIAVSKTHDAAAILPVLAAGQRVFGENRVQEALGKWPELRAAYLDVELHLIGPLQSNKTREAVALFDVIHTIDRPKIARAVAAEMKRSGRNLQLFVQINTGEEPQKAGVAPGEAADFLALCRDEIGLPIFGLMCIPPVDEEAALHFALLQKMAKELGVSGLSMGMSSDFSTAITFGATHVRVGAAIFGARR